MISDSNYTINTKEMLVLYNNYLFELALQNSGIPYLPKGPP